MIKFFKPKAWGLFTPTQKFFWWFGLPVRLLLAGLMGAVGVLILPLEMVAPTLKEIVRQEM